MKFYRIHRVLRILPPQVISYFDRCDTFQLAKNITVSTLGKGPRKIFQRKTKETLQRLLITSLLKGWAEVVERVGDCIFQILPQISIV